MKLITFMLDKKKLLLAGTVSAILVGSFQLSSTTASTGDVVIAEGEFGQYRWSATASPGGPQRSMKELCIKVAMFELPDGSNEDGSGLEGNELRVCGPLDKSGESFPVGDSFGSGRSRKTVLALAFSPRIKEVTIDLGSRGKRRSHLILPRIANRVSKGLPAFRYTVLRLSGKFCIHRIVSFNANRRPVAVSIHRECQEFQ